MDKKKFRVFQGHQGSGSPEEILRGSRKGEYVIVAAALPGRNIANIGILLREIDTDRFHHRFRRDVTEFAGAESEWFEEMPSYIVAKSDDLGAGQCLEWMESTLSNALRISARKIVYFDDHAKAVDGLYVEHIIPTVLHFRTHLPQYSLEAAAGQFGRQMEVEYEGWVEVRADIPLTDDMFVTHVKGHSMEPQIPDSSLCVFRRDIGGLWHGKVLLIEHYGESGGSRYTVKQVHFTDSIDAGRLVDEAHLHPRLTLTSNNPAYQAWDVDAASPIRVLGEFLFVI
jgi:hypothetical protein